MRDTNDRRLATTRSTLPLGQNVRVLVFANKWTCMQTSRPLGSVSIPGVVGMVAIPLFSPV